MELVLRVDEVGFDVRTMRRLRIRLRARWTRLKGYFRTHHPDLSPVDRSGSQVHGSSSMPQTPRDSLDSVPPAEPQSPDVGISGSASSSGSSGTLSKRLQLYARGVHLQVFVMPGQKTGNSNDESDESIWFGLGAKEDDRDVPAAAEAAAAMPEDAQGSAGSAAKASRSSDAGSQQSKHTMDSNAHQFAANLAKKISTTLRTYTYFASMFARWVDISVSDISIKVVRSNEMARAGHGVTLYMSNVLLWAESARDSRSNGASDSGTRGWNQVDILSSLREIVGWLLRVTKIRRARPLDDQALGPDVSESDAHIMSSNVISRKRLRERLGRLSPRPGVQDRSQKYRSTLAFEVSGVRVFPGIQGAQQHSNSRWELVKMLVMQDMLPSKASSVDGDKPHHRGPVFNCQRCTVRNEVITSFWGLPKKVDQSIEFGQTHVRAGILESLLDEIAVMCVTSAVRASGFSIRGLRALNSQLASILQQYDQDVAPSSESTDSSSANHQPSADGGNGQSVDPTVDAAYARDQVNRMLFQLHEVLSKLRMEHVGIALRVAELVFDLPLAPDKNTLIVKTPAMLRWRQRNIEIECGYMWNSISSGLGSRVSTAKLQSDGWDDSAGPATSSAKPGGSEDESSTKDESTDYAWSEPTRGMFARGFEGEYQRRSKDSTAFVRVSAGQVQMIALKTPSMTPDTRAEELVPRSPGFKLRDCTLYGEMSAFLSEDLSQHPCPQPIFTLEVGRPELLLDLQTQLAVDEAKRWARHIGRRFRVLRRVLRSIPPKDTQQDAKSSQKGLSHHARAIICLIFADVKAHITIERAMYAVKPQVALLQSSGRRGDDTKDRGKHIAMRIRHVECHVSWSLVDDLENAGESSSDDSSEADSSSNGHASVYKTPDLTDKGKRTAFDSCADQHALTPSVRFRLTTSPIEARWEQTSGLPEREKDGQIPRTLLQVKHGIRSHGTARLCIGQTDEANSMPWINADVDAEVGEAAGMIRDYDFRNWLSMQPLWLVTELMRVTDLDHKRAEQTLLSSPPAPANSDTDSRESDPIYLPPIQERRKDLTATLRILFESIRLTVMACDNDEDVQSGIEHGTQICLSRGHLDVRANGGSLESPHFFGFRPDAGRTTLNIECQRATMFLLSAVPSALARAEVLQQDKSQCSDLAVEDLCGYVPDTVNQHIVLLRPQFSYSRRKLEPHRSCLIFDLNTASFSGTTSVTSVYRWSVFMHHVKYWSRRKKLARRMATQHVAPSPPDDILVSINSDLLDLNGSLVSPLFFDLDAGLAKSFEAEYNKIALSKQSPEMKLKMPHVRFTIEKTKDTTDSDLTFEIRSPIATLYGSSTPRGQTTLCNAQPLMSLKECKMSFRFPRKAKRAQLGADDGVRGNSRYSHIDIEFERAAMAIGHRYNMAETIDGYLLMQKGCKRIARKSSSSCYPPLPFPEEALNRRCTAKTVLSALGDPRIMMPPPLRSLSNALPESPPVLSEPDDIPSIDFHGPEFSIMIHDDPFETALSRIHQVGLHEQRERLSRLESFNTKATELRAKREQEYSVRRSAIKKTSQELRESAGAGRHAKDSRGQRNSKRSSSRPIKGRRSLKGAATFSSAERAGPRAWGNLRPMMAYSSTFSSSNTPGLRSENAGSSRKNSAYAHHVGMNGVASMSMQDVTEASSGGDIKQRQRTNSAAAETVHGSFVSLSSEGKASINVDEGSAVHDNGTDDNDDDRNYEDITGKDGGSESYQQMVDSVNAEIEAARHRLLIVESREWVKAIRKKMMPPQAVDETENQINDGMDFGEIFDMPSATSLSHAEQQCGSPNACPPYSYVAAAWTHPSVPLGHLFMSPVWISLDTPLSLLEFSQVENYVRYLDHTTPHDLKWSTLVPTRLRIKCGGIKMQLRDFPFPLFKVPDPYRSETKDTTQETAKSYDSFYGGIEISGSVVIAERSADRPSLRSVYIPVGPRSKESDIDLAQVGWYFSKSLQFPRIFSSLSIMLFSAPSMARDNDILSFHHKYLQSRLPPLPIMSTWGASYQPVISAFMQRIESATSKTADVSPNLPWWDKQRLRNHIRCRMAVIDAPPISRQSSAAGASRPSADDLGINVPSFSTGNEQGQRRKTESSDNSPGLDSAREKGQMFFLALDGRDPYQVTQKPGSYLFTMRGGVRVCINEGIPGSELWDKVSGRGIYSVPTEDAVPPSATLGEFLRLRCKEFLMGVPIIVDRQSMLLKSIDPLFGNGVGATEESTPDMEDLNAEGTLPQPDPQSWKESYSDLLRSISRANSARYTFVTQNVHQLYHKVMLHLSGGVRLGIGISTYIPPDRFGLRHNHWEVQPIAPEHAAALAFRGIKDAYVGCRSSKLHTSVSLLCPFTEKTTQKVNRSFADLYLDRNACLCLDVEDQPSDVLHLRMPDKSVLEKQPKQWSVYDTDSLVSPMHSLFTGKLGSVGALNDSGNGPLNAHDLFFTPFSCADDNDGTGQDTGPTSSAEWRNAAYAKEKAVARPQCQLHASAAIVEGVTNFLPLFVARMMLPVRKGSLYPFTETSDNKLGKCLRSMRLVLDLKNVELAYSQRDFEVKELETKEMAAFGYGDPTKDIGLSPTPSDGIGDASGLNRLGAKAEGTMRELKARVESFSFNLLLEQASVKLQVGTDSVSAPSVPQSDLAFAAAAASAAASTETNSMNGGGSVKSPSNGLADRKSRSTSFSIDQAPASRPRRKAAGSSNRLSTMSRTESSVKLPRARAATETNVLRWGVGDASLEIDYLDVRLTQMAFIMPLFFNTSSADIFKTCTCYNGLWFDGGSLGALSEFERSWISNSSIRDLKELNISEAIFSNPSVVCVLWSPRMVYFTQRPEWTRFDDALDVILDSNIAPASAPSPKSNAGPDTASYKMPSGGTDPLGITQHLSNQPEALYGPEGLASLTSTIAGVFWDGNNASEHSLLQRSLSAHRARALSDLRQPGHSSRPLTSGADIPDMSIGSGGIDAAAHRRNTSMPWISSNNVPFSETDVTGPQNVSTPPVPVPLSLSSHPATTPSHFGFLGSIFPTGQQLQKASTPPPQLPPAPSTFSSSPYSSDMQPASSTDLAADSKSPHSAMQYKSSFHLLELARSRQRRLTVSNSRQSINVASPPQHPRDLDSASVAAELRRRPSIPVEQTLTTHSQMSRMMPTGPDPKVIMRDSRSTQAMLLCKRKEMLGTAIRQEQIELDMLSHEFEHASSRHNEQYRREMIRKAEHIYELVARRKLINRCLRFLGVDPSVSASAQPTESLDFNDDDDGELDHDTQQVEKILASLYRHRCLIYSGYLIWTTQVRDKLMRFLYIQDCLTAISYYMSEAATKVVRKGASPKGQEDADRERPIHAAPKPAAKKASYSSLSRKSQAAPVRHRRSSRQSESKPTETHQQFLSPHTENDLEEPRKRRPSTGQNSVASTSSNRTIHLPGILRRLRSNDRLSERNPKESPKGGSTWKSKMAEFGKSMSGQSHGQHQQHQKQKHEPKHEHRHGSAEAKQKPKERRKEGYKPSKTKLVNNKFERGLKSVWDDFLQYHPYYSILVEFLNSQVSMRVDENESTTSAIAVAERVQLHRILLCNESDALDNIVSDGSGSLHVNPPDDESIIKTRSLIELENVQVFTAKSDDFENLPAYFVDCTYGSRLEGDSSKLSTIWPAWVPIELLLSQSKHKIRGIFEDHEKNGTVSQSHDDGSDGGSSSDSDPDEGADTEQSTEPNGRPQTPRQSTGNAQRKRRKRGKAWWLEDLSKYKRLMDRNNGLVVYDKANPYRIQGDTSERMSIATEGESAGANEGAGADEHSDSSNVGDTSAKSNAKEHDASRGRSGSRGSAIDEGVVPDNTSALSLIDSIDDDEVAGGSQGLSHRANHISVFLPELNLACTAEQYIAVYETVTDLLVFSDPEKAAYMDHLNTILLGMDMSDLSGLLSIIQATQGALRERMPIIHDWYTVQHGNVILFRESRRTTSTGASMLLERGLDMSRQRFQANSLLTLDRHRRALEQQLRTAMDIFGAAQKQIKQQRKIEKLSKTGSGIRRPRQPTMSSVASGEHAGDRGSTTSRRRNTASGGGKADASTGRGKEEGLASGLSSSSTSFLSSRSTGRRADGETHGAIARTIHLFISKATWHMLENDEQPLCDMTLRWASLKAVTTSDQATHLLSEVHLLYIVNRLPNPMFTDLVGPYIQPKQPKPDFCVEKMIRVRWSELAPVGGISIVERFEVNLFPIRLQLSHDIAQKLINYLYPPQDSASNANESGKSTAAGLHGDAAGPADRDTATPGPEGASRATTASATQSPVPSTGPGSMASVNNVGGAKSLFTSRLRKNLNDQNRATSGSGSARSTPGPSLSASATPGPETDDRSVQAASIKSPLQGSNALSPYSGRSTPMSLFSETNAMISMSRGGDNRNQVDQMKKRASSNKMFVNIKIGGSTLCISYQGRRASNITDLRDFEFHAPTLELRNQVESYYELLMQVKKEYMSVVVHHTGALVKEKFRQLHNRKAWSRSSFGPDWEARKLLIEMDRRVEEDMVA
ncbi:Protein SABRE, partial [Coemansia sp. IMI 209127]